MYIKKTAYALNIVMHYWQHKTTHDKTPEIWCWPSVLMQYTFLFEVITVVTVICEIIILK